MYSCAICGCRKNKKCNITFHRLVFILFLFISVINSYYSNNILYRFPTNLELNALWKKICNFSEDDDVHTLFVCTQHFTSKDYVDPAAKMLGGRLQLKLGVYPTIKVPNPVAVHKSNFYYSFYNIIQFKHYKRGGY